MQVGLEVHSKLKNGFVDLVKHLLVSLLFLFQHFEQADELPYLKRKQIAQSVEWSINLVNPLLTKVHFA